MLPTPVVRNADLKKLEAAEAAKASELGLAEYRFATNEEMLAVIGRSPVTA
jgi:hypothetical protein